MTTIQVTDKAKKELLVVLKEHTQKYIRLFIQGVGWGGPRLGLALDELKDSDEKINSNGVDIIYDRGEQDYIEHSVIDYEDSFIGRGFVVKSALPGMCWC